MQLHTSNMHLASYKQGTCAPPVSLHHTQTRRTRTHTITAANQKSSSFLLGALDKVLGQINGMVVKEVQKGKGIGGGSLKKVSFNGSAKEERVVQEPVKGNLDGRDLPAYLRLPLDEYSLLDPTWISRPDPDAPNLFLLKVPLQEVSNVNVQPSLRIKVDILEDRVCFQADDFSIDGDPRFQKEQFQIDFTSTLRHEPVPASGGKLDRLWKLWNKQQRAQPLRPPPPQATAAAAQAAATAAAATQQPSVVVDADGTTIDVEASSSSSASTSGRRQGDKWRARQAAAAGLTEGVSAQESGTGSSSDEYAVRAAASSHNSSSSSSIEAEVVEVNASSERDQGQPDAQPASAAQEPSTSTTQEPVASTVEPDLTTQEPATSSSSDAEVSEEIVRLAGLLQCEVKVGVSMVLPYPISVVPGPLLSLGGGLITKAAIRGLLPAFLQLLSIDYGRWASGVPRRQTKGTGSLLQRVPPPQPSSDESENSTDEDSLGNSTDSSGSTDETAAGSSEKKE